MPTVTVSNKLAENLEKKDRRYIVVDLASCKTCGGAVSEVFARLAKDAEIDGLDGTERRFPCVDEQGAPLLIGGANVEMVVINRFVRIGEKVRIDLRRFLGVADIAIEGAEF